MPGANYSLGITADASGLKQELGQASQSVKSFGQAAQDTAAQVEDQVNSQVRSLATATNYKRELRDATREVQNLTMAYRQMTEEERNSPLGKALQEQLEGAKQRAAELTDMVGDLNQAIRAAASDTAPFDAVTQGFGVLRDSMSAIVAVSGMAGASTAEFEQTMKDLATVITAFNALISVTNALQKQSALMTAMNSIKNWANVRAKKAETVAVEENSVAVNANTAAQTSNNATKTAGAAASGALTAATEGATVATGKLTVATRALNLVAKANPYVMLASILLTVGTAFYALFSASHKATDELKKAQEAAKKAAEAQEKLKKRNQDLASSASELKVKFAQLGAEFATLKTKAEKQKWIEENQSRFNELGIEINGVKMAEDVFVRNTGAVVAAMIARARAMKMIDQAVDDMDDLDKKFADMDREFVEGSNVSKSGKYYRKYKGGNISDEEAKRAGVRTTAQRAQRKTYVDNESGREINYTAGYDDYSKEEIKKIEAARQAEGRAAQKAVKSRYEAEKQAILDNVTKAVKAQYDADKKLYSLVNKPGTAQKKSGGGSKSKEETPEKGSLADLKKQREELKKIQQNATYSKHKTNADEVEREIRRLDQLIADEEFIIDFNTDPAKVSLKTIEDQYNRFYAKARSQKLSPEEQQHMTQSVGTLNQAATNKKYAAGIDVKPAEDELISLQKKADEIFGKMQNTEIFGTDTFSELEKQYNDALSEVQKKKVEMGIDTKAAEGSIDDLQAKIVALLGERNALSFDIETDESKAKIAEIDSKIRDLNGQLSGSASELKISTESAHASIKAMEDRVADLKTKLNLDVTLGIEDQKEIVNEILGIEKEIKQHKITIGLETDPSLEELKRLAKQTQDALKPKRKSSFDEAVPAKPAKNDYEGQLRSIQQVMDANDNMLEKLEEVKEKYEEIGQTGSESYAKVLDKMKELKEANEELAKQAKQTDKDDKKAKKRAKNWEYAAEAVDSFGETLGSIGDATDSPELNVAGVIAQTLGNLALSASEAIAQSTSMGPWGWIAFSIAAMAQLASMVAQVHSLTGGYATGGIVGGNSFTHDRLTAKVNSGEMILNQGQQYRLWALANGRGTAGASNAEPQVVDFVLRGQDLYGCLRNFSKIAGKTGKKTGIR